MAEGVILKNPRPTYLARTVFHFGDHVLNYVIRVPSDDMPVQSICRCIRPIIILTYLLHSVPLLLRAHDPVFQSTLYLDTTVGSLFTQHCGKTLLRLPQTEHLPQTRTATSRSTGNRPTKPLETAASKKVTSACSSTFTTTPSQRLQCAQTSRHPRYFTPPTLLSLPTHACLRSIASAALPHISDTPS